MDIASCKGCGRLFNRMGNQRLCTNCLKKMEDKFVEVKKYVRENPNIGIKELSEAMDVSTRQITQWVREERLIFSEDSPIGLPCESCGKSIKTGRFCELCKSKLTNDLREAAGYYNPVAEREKLRSSKDNKMRFLDN